MGLSCTQGGITNLGQGFVDTTCAKHSTAASRGPPGSVAYGVAGMSCAGIPTNQIAEDSLRILKTPTWVTLGRIAAAEGKALMCLAEGVQASN